MMQEMEEVATQLDPQELFDTHQPPHLVETESQIAAEEHGTRLARTDRNPLIPVVSINSPVPSAAYRAAAHVSNPLVRIVTEEPAVAVQPGR